MSWANPATVRSGSDRSCEATYAKRSSSALERSSSATAAAIVSSARRSSARRAVASRSTPAKRRRPPDPQTPSDSSIGTSEPSARSAHRSIGVRPIRRVGPPAATRARPSAWAARKRSGTIDSSGAPRRSSTARPSSVPAARLAKTMRPAPSAATIASPIASATLPNAASAGSATRQWNTMADDVANLVAWYWRVGRDLPWRAGSPSQRELERRTGVGPADPYAILVAEVMCQQTQVARVVPRFEAWVERWPTAEALAAARLAEVLTAWVGLGYNRRARVLWEAAGVIATRGWPNDLESLPGVGPYTAAAVGSFAFGRDDVAVDVNARRVYARWGRTPARGTPALNQAVMELGATLCRAHAARCDDCPVAGCAARGTPVACAPRRPRPRFEETSRFARGRVVAALAGREPWPDGLGAERIEAALDALVRDGLVIRNGADRPRLA